MSNHLCRNSSSPGVLELKDIINPRTLNHVTCAGTLSEEETWVGTTTRLFWFCRRRTHMKARQTNSQKNINCVVNILWIWCERGEIPLQCFCVWNVRNANILRLFLLKMKLYRFVKFSLVLVMGETLKIFFLGFQISFVSWNHLGCPIFMSLTLKVCEYFWCILVCFRYALESLRSSVFGHLN